MVKKRYAGYRLRHVGFVVLSIAFVLSFPLAARAQSTLNPYASVQYEHDSNVFRVENSQIAEQFYHGPQLDDNDLRYVAGLDGTYLWGGLQKLTANLEGRRIDYDHFNFLDHSEYLANAQLDWKVGSILDGLVQFRQEHVAAYFADDNSTSLELNTDRNIVIKANLIFRTDWRLETGANSRNYQAPLQEFPDFVERQTGTHLGLSYLGVTNLSYGIGADHISGSYNHAPGVGVGPYTQTSEYLQFTYAIKNLESIVGALGYTKRDQTGEPNLSAVTGKLKYIRQLTGKTSINASIERAANSYIASAGSEIDTILSVGADWHATYKLSVGINASYESSKFIGQVIQVIPDSTANNRTDHLPGAGMNVTYQAFRRLQLKAFVNEQARHSNVEFNRFNDTTVGIQALAHWR